MAEQSFVSTSHESSNRVLWYVLGGVVSLAILLGAGVWWYGNKLVQETPSPSVTPKPVVLAPSPIASPIPSAVASPSAEPVGINLVGESKSITFPKAGRVYLYYLFFASNATTKPYVIDLVTSKMNISVETPAGLPKEPNKMHIIDTGLDVAAGEVVAIQPYDFGNFSSPSTGWIKPVENGTACGSPGHIIAKPDVFKWMRATIAAVGEPIVSEQCWTDNDPSTSDIDYNDFLLVFTYGKPLSTSPSPSPSPSRSPSPSPSRTPSPSPSPSPSSAVASPSPTPTPSPTSTTTTVVSPSPRSGVVDTSAGVPVTGVIEDTIKAFGVGAVMILLGLWLL